MKMKMKLKLRTGRVGAAVDGGGGGGGGGPGAVCRVQGTGYSGVPYECVRVYIDDLLCNKWCS